MALKAGKENLMNILVCDDDREIVNAIEIYLKNEGYGVFKSYDGFEALDVISKNEIHLVHKDRQYREYPNLNILCIQGL